MAILISGANGFLGKKLLPLINSDEKIFALTRNISNSDLLNHENIEWIEADLSIDLIDISKLDSISSVIHLAGATLGAGNDEKEHFNSNELTTLNLLQSISNHCKNIIYTSSQVVYGNPNNLDIDENFKLDSSLSPYAASKANSENWLRWFQKKTSGRYISLRLCGFIDGGGLIDYVIDNALENKDIELYGRGEITRDYIHSSDGVSAIKKSINIIDSIDKQFLPINIGSGQLFSSNEIAQLIINTLNSKSNIIVSDKDGPFRNLMLNIEKARNILKFTPANLIQSIIDHTLKKQANKNE